mmetsp:Transcript_12988/g.18618  ORF Transcript_12988/g.18618 Transcript_12988/m.18618 type:complete len:154 (+) Transcript_12988:1666-2127(+)
MLVEVPAILRTPRTDNEVASNVKTKPKITTNDTFASSKAEPRGCASGNVTKLGTKNTASHLDRIIAPGLKILFTESPQLLLMVDRIASNENNKPQPAREDGNEILAFLNHLLNATSISTNESVEATDERVDDITLLDPLGVLDSRSPTVGSSE